MWEHHTDDSASSSLLQTPSVSDATGGHRTRGGERANELLLPFGEGESLLAITARQRSIRHESTSFRITGQVSGSCMVSQRRTEGALVWYEKKRIPFPSRSLRRRSPGIIPDLVDLLPLLKMPDGAERAGRLCAGRLALPTMLGGSPRMAATASSSRTATCIASGSWGVRCCCIKWPWRMRKSSLHSSWAEG